MFNIRLGKEVITHEELLQFLPFECAYACTEDGKPDWNTVVAALSLISIDAIVHPYTGYNPPIN
jgi:hypothetical protein